MRIRDALLAAQAQGVPRLDAQLLLGHLLGRTRTWLVAHDDEALGAETADRWPECLRRRAAGEPLAYVVGEVRFCGLLLEVGPVVLVPRPETEMLVEWALEKLDTPTEVADLGTGSGAIALALKAARPALQVLATDASTDALRVAQRNAQRHGLDIHCVLGDWWAPLAGRRFGLVVSNPPYVAGDDPHLPALRHEPRAALTPEGDGLAALREIIRGAPAHLLPRAWLMLEHGHDQAEAVQALLTAQGFAEVQTRLDLAGLGRCTAGRMPERARLPTL
jgi:release factor glutamine methyltransferase